MKIINTGNQYRVYGDDLRTYAQLPAGYYKVIFQEMSGFSLAGTAPFPVAENKVYGTLSKKVTKVMDSLDAFPRHLGVILSGPKGIGKSLFSRMLAEESIRSGMPVIVVDQYIPGIGNFLESIRQTCMILFDEFDKTFADLDNGKEDPQTTLLSMFDGTSSGKKLFVITCNNLRGLNDFLLNRPGRFHYHFRFGYPQGSEIRKYLEDKVDKAYHGQIIEVEKFARKVHLNYDCLRAIAFELNTGSSFAAAIDDLNIVNVEEEYYSIVLHYSDGTILYNANYRMDMFGSTIERVSLYDAGGSYAGCLTFHMSDLKVNPSSLAVTLPPEKVTVDTKRYDDDTEEYVKTIPDGAELTSITIEMAAQQRLKYAV